MKRIGKSHRFVLLIGKFMRKSMVHGRWSMIFIARFGVGDEAMDYGPPLQKVTPLILILPAKANIFANEMTVLLVDDDEDDQDIFKEACLLIDPTIEFLAARDGQDGLSLLENRLAQLPDFIFLDVNMPRMDGKEFLRKVKSDPRFDSVPIVMYSTSKHRSELGQYFSLGASSYITKPSEFNALIACLKSILD